MDDSLAGGMWTSWENVVLECQGVSKVLHRVNPRHNQIKSAIRIGCYIFVSIARARRIVKTGLCGCVELSVKPYCQQNCADYLQATLSSLHVRYCLYTTLCLLP